MKVPMKWLKEYTEINLTAEEYASKMVMAGNGVEGVEKTGEQFDNVVVGHVLSCEMHPNSDHLHVCTVDVGQAEPLQIVCGAPNVHEGDGSARRSKALTCPAASRSSAASCAASRVRACCAPAPSWTFPKASTPTAARKALSFCRKSTLPAPTSRRSSVWAMISSIS